MTDQYIFGYGSLVNRETHAFENVYTARLTGWRRVWRHTLLRPVAYLSVEPDPGSAIDGLIMGVSHPDPQLEQRERGYDRHAVELQVDHDMTGPASIEVYAVHHEKHGRPEQLLPVYLSYIDVVVQGYLREYGESGVQHFFETTNGWRAPVLDDRKSPYYPRHTQPLRAERALTDHWLNQLSAKVKQL